MFYYMYPQAVVETQLVAQPLRLDLVSHKEAPVYTNRVLVYVPALEFIFKFAKVMIGTLASSADDKYEYAFARRLPVFCL